MTHLTFSTSGGAGVVASRLHQAQQKLGWESDLIAASSSDLRSKPLEHPSVTLSTAIDNYVYRDSGFEALYSDSRDKRSVLKSTFPNSDIFHLHWINGLFDISTTQLFSQKPVFWTLHDMNPFTGGCHHSFGCERFITDCGACPAVRSIFQSRPPKNLERKIASYKTWPQLHVVTPSSWLAEQAKKSAAFSAVPISVIHNPVNEAFFEKPKARKEGQNIAPPGHTVFTVVASNLDDPIKNVGFVVDVFTTARLKRPDLALILVGSGGGAHINVPGVRVMGSVGAVELREVFDQSDALLIPSLAENSPGVAFEAAARGVIPVVANSGGLPEIAELFSGYLCGSEEDWLEVMTATIPNNPQTAKQKSTRSQAAHSIAAPDSVAKQYLDLYEATL